MDFLVQLPELLNFEAPDTIEVNDVSFTNGATDALNGGSADWGIDENTFGNHGSAAWGSSQESAEFSSRDGDHTSSFGQGGSAEWGSSQNELSSAWTAENTQTSSTDEFGSSAATLPETGGSSLDGLGKIIGGAAGTAAGNPLSIISIITGLSS
ncbi:hypothetical protein [Corynebacterium uterequi]|uniref:Uncharacterized protein n=1 Tax=Corynebacterium uterequi TaxID=1072256 RepID=A0A0G3HD44_9CORY|nr:hypothetical protein [Corynebacterium uterequi]AKK11204.1 hypothetical protein CUTER_06040 [Corynebacterium uterequi]